MWRGMVLLALAGLVGCGGASGADDGGAASADAGVASDGGAEDGAVASDAGGGGDAGAGSDAGPGADGGAGSDAGPVACGAGERDTLNVARNCQDLACFDDATCVAQQLEAQDHVGFTACGTPLAITPGSSDEACMEDAPFGGFETPKRCGLLSFSGEVRFYCAADGSEIVARWHAHFSPPAGEPGIYYYLGHEFWAGSGGGSGDSYSWSVITDDFGEEFFGFQAAEIPAGGATRLQVWFMSGDLMSEMYVAGGFAADVPPS